MELDVTNTARNNPSLFYISNCQIVKFCVKLTEFNVTNIACNNPSQFYIQNRQIVKLHKPSYQNFVLQFKHFVYSKIESRNSYYNI
jgi:hypothetical protein